MPVTTRATTGHEHDPLDLAEHGAAGEGADQSATAGVGSPAPQGVRASAGGGGGTPGAAARLAAGSAANARGRAGGPPPPTASATSPESAAFSQEQLAALAAIVARAVSEHATSPSDVRGGSQSIASAGGDRTVEPAPGGAGTQAQSEVANSCHLDGAASGTQLDYVPDYGVRNPHANAVYTGGDTYERPQRYNMYRDATFDRLKSKPNGTLFEAYTTLEPSLRYLWNAKTYLTDLTSEVESGTVTADEFVLHADRLVNTMDGVYSLVNRYVGLIHLRAQFGDNPTAREKAKLEHLKDKLADEDFLPASLDERIREISSEFDDAFYAAKKTALAKKAANAGGGGGGDNPNPGGGAESKRAKAKRLEQERKAKAAAAAAAAPAK